MASWGETHMERETQVGGGKPSAAASARPEPPYELERGASEFDLAMFDAVESTEIQGLLKRCMDGTEPLPRPLGPSEPRKLSALAINIVLMKVAGYKGPEIAEVLGVHRHYVTAVTRHPYGQKIITALLPRAVAASLDVRSRLKNMAVALAERTYEVGMTTEDENVLTRITFGMMDRAGYATQQELRVKHSAPGLAGGARALDRLASAIEASARVDQIVTADYKIIESEVSAPLSLPAGGAVSGAAQESGPESRLSGAREGLSVPHDGSSAVESPLEVRHA